MFLASLALSSALLAASLQATASEVVPLPVPLLAPAALSHVNLCLRYLSFLPTSCDHSLRASLYHIGMASDTQCELQVALFTLL